MSPTRGFSANGHDSVTETKSVLSTESAIAMILFRDGTRVAGTVVEPLHPYFDTTRIAFQPLGTGATISIEVAAVKRAFVLRSMSWAESHEICRQNRERFHEEPTR